MLHLRTQEPNAATYSGGEIFRNIRNYERLQDSFGVNMAGKWLAKLSNDLRVKIRTLSRACNGRLLGAFDELLPFVGLWTAFKLGSLHRILPMGAYEVLKCEEIS